MSAPDSVASNGALVKSIVVGTILQLVMVIAGHYSPAIAGQFAAGGMTISGIAGWSSGNQSAGPLRSAICAIVNARVVPGTCFTSLSSGGAGGRGAPGGGGGVIAYAHAG